MLDTKEKKHEKEETIICTSTSDRTGTSIDHQQNVVIMDQPVSVEEIYHNNNEEQNEMLYKEDEVTILLCNYVYERRMKKMQTSDCVSQVYNRSKSSKGNRHVQSFHLFTELTSRHEVHLEGQQQDIQISPPTIFGVETVSFKSSSCLEPKKKGHDRKSQALTGSSSRSVPRKRNRKTGIEEIEDGKLNSRRWTYFPGKNEKSPSIFDHASKQFDLVDEHIGYKESLLKFAQNLGPTAQIVASKKLAQTTSCAFQAPIPHFSSTRRLSDDHKGKNVIMDRGNGRHSVSAGDERPMGLFDRVGTLSAGRACLTSFPDAVTNANTVRKVPIAFEARPRQNSYPSTTVRSSRLSAMCHASRSTYGVWGGHMSTPFNEIKLHADIAALGQGLQKTLHNSHMQLQNQLGSESHQQQQIRLEQQPLPLLRNMFDTGTSHAGNFSVVPNHQTTSNAAQNGQQLPLEHRSYLNLELQLGTKPPSPHEAS